MIKEQDNKLLIIVNNIPPYILEIVNILAAPKLSTCRFRYQIKYAPTISNVNVLAGKFGTIVLRNRGNTQFLPLRKFRCIKSKLVGDVIYLTVELYEISASPAKEEFLTEHRATFDKLVNSAVEPYPNKLNEDLLNLILFEEGTIFRKLSVWYDSSDKDEVAHWGNSIKIISAEFGFVDIDYYKVVGLYDSKGENVPFKSISKEKYGYPVSGGEKYVLEVLQRTYTGKTGDSSLSERRFLILESNDEGVVIHKGQKNILGKYDLLNYNINITDKTKSSVVQTFLFTLNANSSISTPSLEIPLIVKTSLKSKLVKFAFLTAFAVFLFSFLFADMINGWFSQDTIFTAERIEKFSIIGMIISANVFGIFAKEITSQIKDLI